ncbi:MAG: hypothetical protein JO370_08280, partial [Paucibacter sp.]|nr:hypothetical protein [Roseateles sp.]
MAYPNALALSDARSTRLHPARRQPLPTVATPAEDADLPSGHLTGFTLGWDHGHYGLTPPVELMFPGSSIRLGWEAARKAFGMRVLHPRAQTRRWLALRIDAWLRGISFELTQVTPHYLQQLETSWCPVLRRALDRDAEPSEPSSVARVRCDAGFAAGNLVVMSQQAQSAKAELSWQEAQERASSVEVGPIQTIAGLDAREWQRMAVLCSFVTPMPQSLAANIPMLLLPPNRLRLLNPIQALQAL